MPLDDFSKLLADHGITDTKAAPPHDDREPALP